MNISKKRQPRFWDLWRDSGAVINVSQPANKIVVRDTGDGEDIVEGGINWIYEIVSCDVGEKEGTLEYENRAFPSVPNFTGKEPSAEYRRSIPKPGRIYSRHVRNMSVLRSDEIAELRERGVRIKVRRRRTRYLRAA